MQSDEAQSSEGDKECIENEDARSVELRPNEPYEMPQACPECTEQGWMRLLLVPDIFFPNVLISSFACTECGYKDKQVDGMEESTESVKIVCKLCKKEDLSRYIAVAEGTRISIESGEQGIAYIQQEDAVMVVESMIRSVLEKLISEGTMPETPLTEEECKQLDEYKDIALLLQHSLTSLDITLVIEDKKGITRVLPVGKKIDENTKTMPVQYFIDESVQMEVSKHSAEK